MSHPASSLSLLFAAAAAAAASAASSSSSPPCCASLGAALPSLDNCGGSRPVGAPFATRSPVLSSRGQVASAHPLASQAGLDVLKAGGSAVDAAIATNLVLAVLEPMMCGPGGDLMVYFSHTLRLVSIRSETLPLSSAARSPHTGCRLERA